VRQFDVSLIGGRAKSLRRHLERRGGATTLRELIAHYVDGNHGWSGVELGGALDELEDNGIATPPDGHGVIRLTIEPPL
jgi:hypothetical protein